jgi:dTDP-4-dehydrorhamnose reductase
LFALKVFITGSNGLLGGYLVRDLSNAGHRLFATSKGDNRTISTDLLDSGLVHYKSADIKDGEAIARLIETFSPDMVVHAAAITQVDNCELNKDECWNTNVTATAHIIAAAEKVRAALIYVSTDFVFSGDKGMYSEEDETGPVNYYGTSKLAAEKLVMESGLQWSICRTVLVYGNAIGPTRSHMLTWVQNEISKGNTIKVVADQVRTPTYAGDLSAGIVLMVNRAAKGIYHISGKDIVTPYEMALKTAQFLSLDPSFIQKVDASSFSQPAKRPPKTGFDISKAKRDLGYDPISFAEGLEKVFGRQL